MCLLVVWLNRMKKPPEQRTANKFDLNDYVLVLASNRDERFDRPSVPVHWWKGAAHDQAKQDCLGGTDAFPGKEGGTWLGLSTLKGKVGALVNIPEKNPTGHLGRGNLVSDFLKSDLEAGKYFEEKGLDRHAHDYPGFQLITLEKSSPETDVDGDWTLNFVSNQSESFTSPDEEMPQEGPRCTIDDDSTFVFSNSPFETPLRKVPVVKAAFEKLRREEFEDEVALVAALLEVMSCKDEYYPDEELEKRVNVANRGCADVEEDQQAAQAAAKVIVGKLSAIFNRTPVFGTRTQTIVLVKRNGDGFLKEKTLQEPIDTKHFVWEEKEVRFKI